MHVDLIIKLCYFFLTAQLSADLQGMSTVLACEKEATEVRNEVVTRLYSSVTRLLHTLKDIAATLEARSAELSSIETAENDDASNRSALDGYTLKHDVILYKVKDVRTFLTNDGAGLKLFNVTTLNILMLSLQETQVHCSS